LAFKLCPRPFFDPLEKELFKKESPGKVAAAASEAVAEKPHLTAIYPARVRQRAP